MCKVKFMKTKSKSKRSKNYPYRPYGLSDKQMVDWYFRNKRLEEIPYQGPRKDIKGACIKIHGIGTLNGDSNGYIQMRSYEKSKSLTLPRLLLELSHDSEMPGFETRHLCGNAFCNNIDHLEFGTDVENQNDRKIDGTGTHGVTKDFNELQIKAIRFLSKKFNGKQIAKIFNISDVSAYKILRKETYKHIKDEDD